MISYTFENILKILPLDKQFKETIQKEYETYDDVMKYEVVRIMCDAVDEYETMLANSIMEGYFAEVQEGKRKLTTDMYEQAKKEVYKEFEEIIAGKREEKQELEEIRKKLQSFLSSKDSN